MCLMPSTWKVVEMEKHSRNDSPSVPLLCSLHIVMPCCPPPIPFTGQGAKWITQVVMQVRLLSLLSCCLSYLACLVFYPIWVLHRISVGIPWWGARARVHKPVYFNRKHVTAIHTYIHTYKHNLRLRPHKCPPHPQDYELHAKAFGN